MARAGRLRKSDLPSQSTQMIADCEAQFSLDHLCNLCNLHNLRITSPAYGHCKIERPHDPNVDRQPSSSALMSSCDDALVQLWK